MLETDINPASADSTVYLKDYQPPNYLIEHVSLTVELGENITTVTAISKYQRNGDHSQPLVIDGEKLELLAVKLSGQPLAEHQYQVDESSLTIADVPATFLLEIVTQLQPHNNTELSGLYQSSGNYCTQCEAEGFRRITYFPDRPDVLAEYEVTLHGPKATCPVLLANGNLVAKGDNSDGTHWAQWHDPHPKPSYLFALVAGDLQSIQDHFVTASGQDVELNIYTQAHNIEKCEHAMASLKNAMLWDEQVYGREYDLSVYNIVAVDDFNMGAMENKGLNVFNSKYVLANQQTATDSDYQGIESVIGHEYFHNWSGNRVTCRDWFQLSLKEGFTVFRDQEFSADMGSRAVKRIRDVQMLRTYQFKEDAGPMAHPVRPDSYQEINNFYTVTIYEKGAEVIRMLHHLVGAAGFRAATDLYFQKFDGQAVTTEDFVACIEQGNDIDLSQFRLWYTQAGTPEISVKQNYDAGLGRLTLTIDQTCPATPGQAHKAPFQIPIQMALFNPQGKKVNEKTLVLTEQHQQFDFNDLAGAPVVSLLRDFSAPIKVYFDQSDAELAHLIKHDDNGFTRFEAMQRLCLNVLLPAIKAEAKEINPQTYDNFLQALKGVLDNPPADQAMLAELLSLPPASYVAEQCKPINPQSVIELHQTLQERLAKDLQAQLHALYLSVATQDKEFSLDAETMSRRALKNTVLKFLVCCDEERFFQLAEDQYRAADNMTDRLAAFTGLLFSAYPDKTSLIADFYSEWQNDSLVLDKWFALQAMIPELKVLSAVHQLLEHPAFSIANPNKVRSLVGAFTGNMRAFHRSDGAGYELVADIVLKLNSINPQVGARLVGTFNSWRSYAEPYASNMKTQLERINLEQELSKDIREIVSKALAET